MEIGRSFERVRFVMRSGVTLRSGGLHQVAWLVDQGHAHPQSLGLHLLSS